MSTLEVLEQRRELVLLSAAMQRAVIETRLNRIEAHPVQALLGSAFRLLQRPWARQVAIVALGIVFKKFHHTARVRTR